ncbi:MAG: sulfur carrier protein ThiS [Aliihoeflea sp.]
MRNIIVNGEKRVVEAATLDALLALLDYEGSWIATAVNGEIVRRAERNAYALADGDRVEILSPMQGG